MEAELWVENGVGWESAGDGAGDGVGLGEGAGFGAAAGAGSAVHDGETSLTKIYAVTGLCGADAACVHLCVCAAVPCLHAHLAPVGVSPAQWPLR